MAVADHHVKSVATAFRVVEALDRQDPRGVTEVARETGVAKSSVYKHLDTLRHLGYVTRTEEGYALSLRWFGAGWRVRQRRAVYRLARPVLDRLARRTGETASLVVEERGDAVYLYQASDATSVAPVDEGEDIPVLLSAGGKAIYSYRPPGEVEAWLASHDLEAETDELLAELRTLRDQRMVIDRGDLLRDAYSAGAFEGHRHVVVHDEPYRNIHAVAVPIRDADGYGIAAIELSGPEASLSGRRFEEEIASLLVAAGKSLETDLLRHRER